MSSFSGGATGGTSERSSLLMGSGSALLQGKKIKDVKFLVFGIVDF